MSKGKVKEVDLVSSFAEEDEGHVVSQAKSPVWEPLTGAVYVLEGGCVARVSNDLKLLTRIAGRRVGSDGHGNTARFQDPSHLATDSSEDGGVSEESGSEDGGVSGAGGGSEDGGVSGAGGGSEDGGFSGEGGGSEDDGFSEACFLNPTHMVSDGDGRLYVADGDRIRCVTLSRTTAGRKRPLSGEEEASAGEAQVSTLPFRAAADITGLAYVPTSAETGGGGLAFSTKSAVYWLPRPQGSSAASTFGTAPMLRPLCLAGTEGLELEESAEGNQKGTMAGAIATFSRITGLSADGRGSLLVLMERPSGDHWVRRVCVPSGATTTLAVGLSTSMGDSNIHYRMPAVLPNGYFIALADKHTCIVDLDLRPPPCPPPSWWGGTARAAEAFTQLRADLGALLDRQPDGTADLSLVVGGRTFHAHRSILTARSRYFQCLLAGGFAEGRARVLDLLDADPDAMALALKWVYTGAVEVPSGKVQAVVELADRLDLLQLGEELQRRVLAEVKAETVVDTLLWADARQLQPLRHALKAWYLAHQRRVLACAAGSVRRLMAASPDLMLELQAATAERAAACSVGVR